MLQPGNYSLVLTLQFLLLVYDLFVNSFSELLRSAPVIQLVLFILQDVGTLFAAIVLFLMLFNTFVFQAGLLGLLCQRFQVTVFLCALHLTLSVSLHVWLMNLRWKTENIFVWSDGLQALFVLQRVGWGDILRCCCCGRFLETELPWPCCIFTSTRGPR
ncbi:transmembrane protein 138 isoform X2 [Dendrobates tinctorius]|uniref:transmembrane protein 138 isoform X2 n=1 Tax=Dendrobates tinctorius TaxID=92724 RepID=UPI003CC9A15B